MRSYSLDELRCIRKNIELGTLPTKKTITNIIHQLIKAEMSIVNKSERTTTITISGILPVKL